MRLFIALPFSQEIREKIVSVQEELKKTEADIKWVEEENLHITLKFLGAVAETDVEKVRQIVRQTGDEFSSFEIELCTLGVFPSLNSPRVIWLGAERGKEKAEAIFQKLEEKLLPLGFRREERIFLAHLTLGRIRFSKHHPSPIQPTNIKLKGKIESLDKILIGKDTISSIQLVQSLLSKHGPHYSVVEEVKLK